MNVDSKWQQVTSWWQSCKYSYILPSFWFEQLMEIFTEMKKTGEKASLEVGWVDGDDIVTLEHTEI